MFSNLLYLETIRYLKNKTLILIELVVLFVYVVTMVPFLRIMNAPSGSLGSEEGLAYQSMVFMYNTGLHAVVLALYVTRVTTSYYKNRFYINIYGVIRSRFKVFCADFAVFVILSAAAALICMVCSYIIVPYLGGIWFVSEMSYGLLVGITFVFLSVLLLILISYGFAHILKRTVLVVVAVSLFSIVRSISYDAVYVIAHMKGNEYGITRFVCEAAAIVLAPANSVIVFFSNEFHMINLQILLTATALALIIVVSFAAVAVSRRLEV